ncbi:PE domain-containing protein [Mycobacterium colombiense]|uniref:Cell motility protein n=1 Tax=Mycobacterium colombiense TaxID=339268 RepID=A0A853LSS1_9MYCO|nr:PE domain-containing protein [Mycobacterium colombiense]OBJ13690.1 cell motility protein [Mycobacterium colombiense]OBJ36536.1 cell motility protein [Mycobacterium colombiense]OBJ57095.1 cell motility protein [Mycobacterium colombiense]
MTLRVIPEGLAATSAAVDAIAAQLAAAHAVAAPVVSVVVPPAADPVSLAAAAVFSERGSQHSAAAAKGVEVLGRAGLGVSLAGVNYVAGDTAAASTYLGA